MGERERLRALGDGLSLDGRTGFHCGDPLDILVCGTWLRARVEYSHGSEVPYHGWYLTGGGGWCPLVAGMRVREPEERPSGRLAW